MSSTTKEMLTSQSLSPSQPPLTPDWIARLQELVDGANLDDAIRHIHGFHPKNLDQYLKELNPDPVLALHVRCLLCEVYDYAGLREDASLCIKLESEAVQEELKHAKTQWEKVWENRASPKELELLKQRCWACLHLGMVEHYRLHEYEEAFQLFDLAREILSRLNNRREPVLSLGALARAYYCLGLTERERYNLYDARRYFSESVECAWARIVQKQQPNAPASQGIPFLKYSIARALGLGMAWIAYARASMSEANSHIVAARLLLQETGGVKYLSNYVDVVHACTQRSRADNLEKSRHATRDMKAAYDALGGDAILRRQPVEGHFVYAQRAAYELAVAHLGAGRLHGRGSEETARTQKSEQLDEALAYLDLVQQSLSHNDKDEKDIRTRCNVRITRSRVFLEKNDIVAASEEVKAANRIGGHDSFSRIDCWTALGEVYYSKSEIDAALKQFRKARNDTRAQTNPKVLAVSDLRIALCHLKLKEVRAAEEILARWRSQGAPGNSNAFVQYLEKEITSQLARTAFVIPGNTLNLNSDYWINGAKKWLAQRAMECAADNKEEAGKLLGVNAKTVDLWLKFEGIDTSKTEFQDPG